MGTTAEKLTYLNETKTQLKDMLNLGGASLTTEPFRQYVDTLKNRYLYFMNNGTQEVWDNWEKVVGEGTTITLNNTEEAPMQIALKGNTYQPNSLYSGQIEQGSIDSTGNLVTANDRIRTTDFIEVKPNTSIVLTFGGASNYLPVLYDSTKTFIQTSPDGWLSSGASYSITSTTHYLKIIFKKSSGNIVPSELTNLIVGNTPSPDYPQDIHVVSGDNSIKVEGKNLIPLSDIISTSGTTSNGITFTLQEDGTIKANGTATGGISIYLTTNYIEQKAGTYTFSDGIVSGQSSTTYFLYADVRHLDETPWDTKYFSTFETTTRTRTIEEAFKFKPRIVVRQGQTLNNVVFKPMLENGSTATTYEAYKGASYPITLPEGMFLGWIPNTDYRDIIFQAKTGDTYYDSLNSTTKESLTYGKWYLNKQIGKVAFSDLVFNEIGGNFSQFSTNGNIAMVYLQNDLKVTGNRDDVFCNLLKPYSSSLFGGLQTGINQYYNATKLLLSVPLANVEEFAGETLTVNNYLSYTQNYIKGLEGYIYYILATPTYTEITDSTLLSQLNALAKSYTGQTNISQENNDLASLLNATALEEMA